jgi:hypothetical protein
MALEDFIQNTIVGNRIITAFFLGALYSIVGIFTAKMIFGSNPDMMAVAFVAILLIPAINKALKAEEGVEASGDKFSVKRLFSEHKDIFVIYTSLFLGIFLSFLFFTAFNQQTTIFNLFKAQLNVAGITGNAMNPGFFSSVLANNMKVLLACLILSLIYGAGSILFIVWNASVWGVVFGYSIKTSAITNGQNPFLTFIIVMIPVMPHLLTEAFSYFSAAIAGGVMSKAATKESWFSDRFNHVATDSLILFGLAIVFVIAGALLEARF